MIRRIIAVRIGNSLGDFHGQMNVQPAGGRRCMVKVYYGGNVDENFYGKPGYDRQEMVCS